MKKFIIYLGLVGIVGCGRTYVDPKVSAATFAANMGGKVTGVSCIDEDSNADGYVSCTIFRQDFSPFGVQCNWRAGGCKLDDAIAPSRHTIHY